MEVLLFISDVGFPIAVGVGGIYFVFITLRFLLDSVTQKITWLMSMIRRLNQRVTSLIGILSKIDQVIDDVTNISTEQK